MARAVPQFRRVVERVSSVSILVTCCLFLAAGVWSPWCVCAPGSCAARWVGALQHAHPLSHSRVCSLCLQVERGGRAGVPAQHLRGADLLLQHHPGQPLPRRPPLQGHVPADLQHRRPAPAVHTQQAPPQRQVPLSVAVSVSVTLRGRVGASHGEVPSGSCSLSGQRAGGRGPGPPGRASGSSHSSSLY